MSDTINVPRELLEDCLIAARGPLNGNLNERILALLQAPTPPVQDDVAKDAARFRWIIQHAKALKGRYWLPNFLNDRKIDAAIDAAMAKEGK